MKNFLAFSLAFITTLFFSFSATAQKKADNWPAKTAFHQIMATTFHHSEDGNFEPIRKGSGEMVAKAKAWMESTPPAAFKKPEIKVKLKQLYAESMALDKLVKSKASDEQLKGTLSKLHDRFHEIIGMCTKEEKEEARH